MHSKIEMPRQNKVKGLQIACMKYHNVKSLMLKHSLCDKYIYLYRIYYDNNYFNVIC